MPAADVTAAPPLAPPITGCVICGRGPTAEVSYVRQTGLLLARESRTHTLVGCRDCGLAVGRDALVHNLSLGWWGIFSAISNPHTLYENAKHSRRLRRLGPPQGDATAAPLPHRPVLARPVLLVPVVVGALLVGFAVLTPDTTPVSQLSTGDCFELPTEEVVSEVEVTPCDQPHGAEVISRIPTFTPVPAMEACQVFAEDDLARSVDGRIASVFTFDGGADEPNAGDVCFVHRPSGRPIQPTD